MLCAAVALFAAAPLRAQPATAGYPVSATHLAGEFRPSVLADGLGGAFIGYKLEYRSPSLPAEILVAHVLPSGARYPEWATLPLSPAGSLVQSNPLGPARVLLAPQGRALAFADLTSGTGTADVVRRVETDGADPTYPGFKPTYTYSIFTVVQRSDGGALILSKVAGSTNCLATVVTAVGTGSQVLNTLAVGNGIQSAVSGDQMAAVASGTDGAIAAIQFPQIQLDPSGGTDIVAVRIDASGHPVWSPAHRTVTAALHDQMDVVATTDGADGILMAWRDQRTGANGSDVYAERLLATGALATGWTAGGKAIAALVGSNQSAPVIASDGAGGAWIAWVDDRNLALTDTDVYYMHVLANGTFAAGFPSGGKALCNLAGSQSAVRIAPDGSGGFFAVWLDARDGEQDLYGQHVDPGGNPTSGWLANGSPLCTDPSIQRDAAIGWVSNGRAIAAWSDQRSGDDAVYSLTLDATTGPLGVPPDSPRRLALAPRMNPARGAIELRLDASEAGEVRVALFDVSGRRLAEQVVAGPGRAVPVRFQGVRPGLYFVTASRGGERVSARVAVVD
jgi:hypothetical protein